MGSWKLDQHNPITKGFCFSSSKIWWVGPHANLCNTLRDTQHQGNTALIQDRGQLVGRENAWFLSAIRKTLPVSCCFDIASEMYEINWYRNGMSPDVGEWI